MTTTPKRHLRLHYNHGLWAMEVLRSGCNRNCVVTRQVVGFTTSAWAIKAAAWIWWGVANEA